MTVLPGLMDVHTHLTMATNFDPYFELSMTPAKEAILGVENAKVTLEAGFTTVRNVGANDYTDVALRDEINAGHIPGPHMQASGPPLGITGGHMDENLLPYQYHLQGEGVADGIPAVQHMVRQNIKYGADLIKIGASGGVLSKGDDPQASQYTLEEMQAIVADAHRLGRKVAAHAHGAEAIYLATEAGVDSIEHGSYVDERDIALMKQKGTYLVPHRLPHRLDARQRQPARPLPAEDDRCRRRHEAEPQTRHPGPASRSPSAPTPPFTPTDSMPTKLDVYVNQYGMTPLAAIQSATLNAADLMGWTDRVGSLDPGKWADLIAVPGDPLQDVRILQHIPFVMKSGIVYKDEAHPLELQHLSVVQQPTQPDARPPGFLTFRTSFASANPFQASSGTTCLLVPVSKPLPSSSATASGSTCSFSCSVSGLRGP